MHTEIPIDKAGRVVIPKSMRDSLGLSKEDILVAVQENGHIILKPARPKGRLEKKGDMWVWSTGGEILTQKMVDDSIEALREERFHSMLGFDDNTS